VVYCVTIMRDVTSMVSEAVSEGRIAVDDPLDTGAEIAREVELTRGVEDGACMTDSITEDRLVVIALAVVLPDGEPEGAAPG